VEPDTVSIIDLKNNVETAELDSVQNMEDQNIVVKNVEPDIANMVDKNVIAENVFHKNANAKPVQKLIRNPNQRSDHEFRHSRIIKI
jgi:hypothetical protein